MTESMTEKIEKFSQEITLRATEGSLRKVITKGLVVSLLDEMQQEGIITLHEPLGGVEKMAKHALERKDMQECLTLLMKEVGEVRIA